MINTSHGKFSVFVVLGLLCLAAAVAVWLTPRDPVQTELESYKRQLAANGEKLAKEDWLPRPGRGNNGAALLVETLSRFSTAQMVSGISQYQLITNNHAKVVWRYDLTDSQGWNPPLDIWELVDEMVRTNQVLYSDILSAVRSGYVEVPYDFVAGRFPMPSGGGMSPYPMFLDIRVVMPLSTHACLRLRQNRPEEACDELAGLMELLQKTLREPNFASLERRAEIAGELCQTTWQFLQFTNLPESRLRGLQSAWQDLDILETVEPTFALERVYVEDRSEAFRRKLSLLHKTPREIFDILTALCKDFNGTRNSLRHNALLRRQSYADEFVDIQRAQAELNAARSLCSNHAGAALNSNLPPFAVLRTVAVAETQRQMAIAAIAIERFHLEKGRFPGTLSELQPVFLKQPPIDFMDGKPLRYKPTQDGLFLLYSVGLDGHDDGGDAWPAKRKNSSRFPQWDEGQDIVWPQPATDAEVAERERMFSR